MRRRATVGSGRGLTPAAALRCGLGVLAGLGAALGIASGCADGGCVSCDSSQTNLVWYPEDHAASPPSFGDTFWRGEITDEAGNTVPFEVDCPLAGDTPVIETGAATVSILCSWVEFGDAIAIVDARLKRVRGTFGTMDRVWGEFDFEPKYVRDCECDVAIHEMYVPSTAFATDAGVP